MDTLTFSPAIDLPLVVLVMAMFIWHFNRWAVSGTVDTNLDLLALLPGARLRVVTLFLVLVLVCWWVDFAVWSLFALIFAFGIAFGVLTTSEEAAAIGFWAAAYLIREWCFGFPQMVLHPPSSSVSLSLPSADSGELLGKTGMTTSLIRPTGQVEIDGVTVPVSSDDGRMIDSGVEVAVTSYRNGRPCVSPMDNSR